MPKVLVLVAGDAEEVLAVAESIHEGARSVRFAEADMRRVPGTAPTGRVARLRSLEDVEELAGYDAVVVGASAASAHEVGALLERAAIPGLAGRLANKLGSIFPAVDPSQAGSRDPLWPLLEPMARYGMILVPPGYAGPGGPPEDLAASARRLGKRLVDIAAWITHARSHHHH